MKKIGCITFHASHNYGSVLQAYALQEFVKTNFDDCNYEIINLRTEIQKKLYHHPSVTKSFIHKIINLPFYKELCLKYERFEKFINEELDLSEEFGSVSDFKNNYDVLVSGGDQIWNTACYDFNWLYFFDGIVGSKKVSYAPSFGPHPSFTDDQKEHIKKCLSEYSSLGVREEGSRKILGEVCGINKNIEIMPDPVLLVDSDSWQKVADKGKTLIKHPYILFYTLGVNDDIYKSAKKIGKILKKDVVVTKKTSKLDFLHFYHNVFDVGPLEFIKLIKDADYVICTSFHACVFSSIFHKKFFALNVRNDNRISGFLNKFGLTNQFIDASEISKTFINKIIQSTDFAVFDETLKTEKEKAFNFLNNAFN